MLGRILCVVMAIILVGALGCNCALCRKKEPEIIGSNFEPPKPAPVPEAAPVAVVAAPQEAPAPLPVPPPAPVVAKPIPAPVVLDLRRLAAQNPNLLSFDEATGRLRFFADLTFDSGSNVVKPAARAALVKLGAILTTAEAQPLRVDVVGHTDSVPVKKASTVTLLKQLKKSTDNQGLSEARAEAAALILEGAKVDMSRMTTKGMGQTQPIADNATFAGKAKNRRVEIFMYNR